MKVCFAYKEKNCYKIIRSDNQPNKYWNLMVVVDLDIENEKVYQITKDKVIEERKYNANIQK